MVGWWGCAVAWWRGGEVDKIEQSSECVKF